MNMDLTLWSVGSLLLTSVQFILLLCLLRSVVLSPRSLLCFVCVVILVLFLWRGMTKRPPFHMHIIPWFISWRFILHNQLWPNQDIGEQDGLLNPLVSQQRTNVFLLRNHFGHLNVLYSLHNELTLFHKYTSTERQREITRVDPNPRDTITWDTTSVVGNSRYPNGLSANYSLIQFTCILFLLLEYICFSIYFLCSPCFSFASITTEWNRPVRVAASDLPGVQQLSIRFVELPVSFRSAFNFTTKCII